jgi:hypothetical protein
MFMRKFDTALRTYLPAHKVLKHRYIVTTIRVAEALILVDVNNIRTEDRSIKSECVSLSMFIST